jgi:hypothetical protein
MKTFLKIIAATMILFIGGSVFASDSTSYSGYSVSGIIRETGKLFVIKNLLDPASDTSKEWFKYLVEARDQQDNGIPPDFPFMDFEQSLINYCLGKRFITVAQANIALDRSQHCGGLTVNGYNLLVLHAGVLAALVDNKHITRQEAQNLLDSCKVGHE